MQVSVLAVVQRFLYEDSSKLANNVWELWLPDFAWLRLNNSGCHLVRVPSLGSP